MTHMCHGASRETVITAEYWKMMMQKELHSYGLKHSTDLYIREYQRLGGTYCLHIQRNSANSPDLRVFYDFLQSLHANAR
jgi:hypothetical protein